MPDEYEGPPPALLEAAGIIAPIVRTMAHGLRERRIKIYKRDTGEVTGTSTYGEAVKGLLAAHALEIEVEDGKRPKEIQCKACGRRVVVPAKGQVPRYCVEPCMCTTDGCNGRAPSKRAPMRSLAVGLPPACSACSRARRNAMWKAMRAKITKTQLSEIQRKKMAQLTAEQRLERAEKATRSQTREQRAEAGQKGARKTWGDGGALASRTAAQRAESAQKRLKTIRARAAPKP